MANNRPPRERGGPPPHRPSKYHKHVADEYEELGNVQVAAELRRHLLGHYERWQGIVLGAKAATTDG